MTKTGKTVNRSATDRLCRLIEAELARQELTAEEVAREARLPSKAFRSLLRHGHRPTLDRTPPGSGAAGVRQWRPAPAPANPDTQNDSPRTHQNPGTRTPSNKEITT